MKAYYNVLRLMTRLPDHWLPLEIWEHSSRYWYCLYCKTLNFCVPFISRISRPWQIRENNGSRIWRAGRPAVFLQHGQHRYPANPGVRLPSVALKSHCHADEGTGAAAAQSASSITTAMPTIPYCWSEPGLTRWSQSENNWPSASSIAVSSQRRRVCIICSRTSVTSPSQADCTTQEHWNL